MAFLDSVNNTPSIAGHGKVGLSALTATYKKKITLINPRLCEGSLDIDNTLKHSLPNEHRWDYAIGYNENIIFIEVHPATTSEVSTVIAKLNWLKKWLKNRNNKLTENCNETSFHWISTNGCNINPQSKHARQLALTGMTSPRAQLNIE